MKQYFVCWSAGDRFGNYSYFTTGKLREEDILNMMEGIREYFDIDEEHPVVILFIKRLARSNAEEKEEEDGRTDGT